MALWCAVLFAVASVIAAIVVLWVWMRSLLDQD